MLDDPNNPASTFVIDVLKAESAPVLETIYATPNLRPRELEDSVDDLVSGRGHPGTTFRGALGVAMVLATLRRALGVVALPEPVTFGLLPTALLNIVGAEKPDYWLMAIGGEAVVDGLHVEVTPVLQDCIAALTGGTVGEIRFASRPLQVIGEVTISTYRDRLIERMDKTVRWANVIAAGRLPGITTQAAFAIDRFIMFSPDKAPVAAELRARVLRSEATIQVVRNLNAKALESARRIVAGIKQKAPQPQQIP